VKHKRKRPRTSGRGQNWNYAVKANKENNSIYSKVPSWYALAFETRPLRRKNKNLLRKVILDIDKADSVVFVDKKSIYYW